MAHPIVPESWDKAIGAPKQKFKFLVEFGTDSLISQIYPSFSYQQMVKSITKPKPTVDTKDASDQETRTWFGSIPDPTKRQMGTVSWSPITIKFVNLTVRNERDNYAFRTFKYGPPSLNPLPNSDELQAPDLDYFFSRLIESMDSSYKGGTAPKDFKWSDIQLFDKPENLIAAYRSTLTMKQSIDFSKKVLQDQISEAVIKGNLKYQPLNPYSTADTKASTVNMYKSATSINSDNCKSIVDSFTKASCVFMRFFGDMKIYDLINNSPSASTQTNSLAANVTIKNGYWTLRNPYVKNVDFGSHEYGSDELMEYSLEIGYESARFVSGDSGTQG